MKTINTRAQLTKPSPELWGPGHKTSKTSTDVTAVENPFALLLTTAVSLFTLAAIL